jgi:Membrane bound FAD containing D-sorbitol dehydrogenase
MTGFTRRKILAGAAATAVGAVGSANLTTQTAAQTTAADDRQLFIDLSVSLTGIARARLVPARDTIEINKEYFEQAQKDPAFESLMQVVRANRSNPDDAADKVLNNSDSRIKYLGRSIILMWYLGAWYEPKKLENFNSSPPKPPYPPDKIISRAAYTQGWTWRVAQAHPMGYSELLFGYWSKEPPALDAFIK